MLHDHQSMQTRYYDFWIIFIRWAIMPSRHIFALLAVAMVLLVLYSDLCYAGGELSLEDIVVAMPTSTTRHPMVLSTRSWRSSMRTVITTNDTLMTEGFFRWGVNRGGLNFGVGAGLMDPSFISSSGKTRPRLRASRRPSWATLTKCTPPVRGAMRRGRGRSGQPSPLSWRMSTLWGPRRDSNGSFMVGRSSFISQEHATLTRWQCSVGCFHANPCLIMIR